MKNVHNKLTCLFGHHQYSEKPGEVGEEPHVHLCKICKRVGYYTIRDVNGKRGWVVLNEEGEHIFSRWTTGEECLFDGRHKCVCWRSAGYYDDWWIDNDGNRVTQKPKNWKHEGIEREAARWSAAFK